MVTGEPTVSHTRLELLPALFPSLQPPLRPPELGIVSKGAFVAIDNVRATTDHGSLGQKMSEHCDAPFWNNALKREGKWRVHADAFLNTGIQVRQVAHLAVLGEGVRHI